MQLLMPIVHYDVPNLQAGGTGMHSQRYVSAYYKVMRLLFDTSAVAGISGRIVCFHGEGKQHLRWLVGRDIGAQRT